MQKIPRQAIPEQDAKKRIHNFSEVALGYTEKQAILEASRCIQCKNPKCVQGCPVAVDIPGFIKLIGEKKYIEAAKLIKETNALPAVCGRVCPQENQCEEVCILGIKSDPVAIGRLERYAADIERNSGKMETPVIKKKNDSTSSPTKKVAIIGSGPAGITCAADLVKAGFQVDMFEAFHKTGGVLVYGIPEFRLPKSIVKAEIDQVMKLGVKIHLNHVIGRIYSLEDLFKDGFSAVFIGVGAGLPSFMNIPGEELAGVYSANEFLTRVNLMEAYKFPEADTPVKIGKKVAVVGGGNVAMDAARSAKRLGADVILLYRRTEKEMPARIEEIHHAKEEGIEFKLLNTPIKINGNEKQQVESVICQQMELRKPDESGRRRPVPIEGSEYKLDIDSIVIAIGNKSNPLLTKSTPGLELNKWGNIEIKDEFGHTSIENVWAGGDIVTGAATVIKAMGAGKKAAEAIIKKFRPVLNQ
ncbi:NADPH-dependent glutamate synthase [Candidatus Margulisiibacteriota bacterium]